MNGHHGGTDRRTLLRTTSAAAIALAMPFTTGDAGLADRHAQGTSTAATPQTPPGESGYAPVNDMEMYYEIHGSGGTPLVMLHGAYSNIPFWGELLPGLAADRTVIAVETQGHGRTADIDRPITYEHMADDVAVFLDHLGIGQADILGYSMGGSTALQVTIRHPEVVRKLVLISTYFNSGGYYPEILADIAGYTPDVFAGTPIVTEYERLSPRPEDFPILFEKLHTLDTTVLAWPTADMEGITAPAFVIAGDSDVVTPEHALETFRLLGGGVPGDVTGLPRSRMAFLPAATHVTAIMQTDLLLAMIPPFLDAPMPDA